MKKSTKIALAILAVLPMLAVLAFYSRLPDIIPTHWGIDGVVDDYGPKQTMLLIGGMGPLFAGLFAFCIKADPRGRMQRISRHLATFIWALALFLAATTVIVSVECLHPGTMPVGRLMLVGCGLLFSCIGNMMPTVRSNFFLGVKTPWTLSSDEVWARTHRLSGKLWFFGGLLMALCALLPDQRHGFILFFCIAMALAFTPIVYSYLLYRRLGEK